MILSDFLTKRRDDIVVDNMVADMEVHMVADMEVDRVADMAAEKNRLKWRLPTWRWTS